MSQIIDELITRFVLDPTTYIKPAGQVQAATKAVAHQLDEAKEKVVEFGRSFSERFKIGELIAPLAAIGTVTGIVELGRDALQTAAKFDVLERKLAGVTGSVQRAKEIMDFGEKESGTYGIFDVAQIDTAATKLEAFGLKSEQYIPVIEKLGAVFGQGGEGLDTFAEAIGRIAEGDPGRAMAILARAGISEADLKKLGVQFNGREVTSKPNVVIGAIDQLVSTKYGGVLGELMDSPEAKTARFSIAWERAMRTAGQAIQGALLPYIETLTRSVDDLIENGTVDRVVKGFTSLFGIDTSNISLAVEKVAGWIEGIPGTIKAVEDMIGPPIELILKNIKLIGAIWAGMWAFEQVSAGLKVISGIQQAIAAATAAAAASEIAFDVASGVGIIAAGAAVAAGIAAYTSLSHVIDQATESQDKYNASVQVSSTKYESQQRKAMREDITNLNHEIGELEQRRMTTNHSDEISDIDAELTKLRAQQAGLVKEYPKYVAQDKAAAAAAAAAAKTAGTPGKGDTTGLDIQTDYLAQIATNTKQTAIDFKRFALGGGDLARMGVTPGEMAGFSHGGTKLSRQVITAFESAFGEMIASHMTEMTQNGQLSTAPR